MPEGVGDHGDALQPDEQHRDGAAVDGGSPEGGVEVRREQHPVRQLGELVVGGPVLELALDVGVVGHGADEAVDLAVLPGDRCQSAAHGPHGAGGRHDAAVDDASLGLGIGAAGDGHDPLPVVGVQDVGQRAGVA